ncbi:MAG: biotin-dependent carboxyltransferase family protein [Sulfolobales archaeon]|nr:biotin-dependent carboxyltransferase family protein [Sulfolobales archaeon]MDW8082763.1 biotin-dependent carboxyltransferase family protein [Sulfolobales archaeon]
MGSLRVEYVAGLATVQDLGRDGYRALGVPVSGALDRLSAVYANALVGNKPRSAVIEVFGAISLKLLSNAVVAVTGGHPRVFVDNVEVKSWMPILCSRSSVLKVAPSGVGRIHYIAVSGGIVCEEVLGSKSTYVRGGMGCLGRPLKVGDVFEVSPIDVGYVWSRVADLRPPSNLVEKHVKLESSTLLRATEGVHSYLLEDLNTLLRNEYIVAVESDRMGYRLEGTPLSSAGRLGRLPSIPTDRGYVQVPPDGRPIVLMSDAQTTGGYAVALHVLPRDTDSLAQLNPGQRVRFKLVDISEADSEVSNYLKELEEPILQREELEYWV